MTETMTNPVCWALQDAKAKLSELVNVCLSQGVQTITRHGTPAVAMVPWETYRKMTGRERSLREFLAAAPRVNLDVERSRETERELEL